MADEFAGFSPDAYVFLMELGFNNNKPWMDANRQRYRALVQRPLQRMAAMLLPDMLEIDANFNPSLNSIVSHINRDTRYSRDKQPYRTHAWLAFRHPGQRLSESVCLYFELSPEGYGYGVGMWGADMARMAELRARALAHPEGLRQVVNDPALARYELSGELYKRDRFPSAPEDIKPYLNRKGLSWGYFDTSLAPTMGPGIYEEVRSAMLELAPVYKYLMGI